MTEKNTISIAFVGAAVDRLTTKGVAIDDLLPAAGIAPTLLANPEARVSSVAYANLLQILSTKFDDEFFGHDSKQVKVGSFAMLCRAVIACHTLKEGLQCALHFYQLLLEDLSGELDCDSPLSWLVLRETPGRAPSIFAQEMLLMFLHRLACWLVNRRIPIRLATFNYPAPLHAGEYSAMFDGNTRFDQKFTGIAFDSDVLALPLRRSRRDLDEFLSSVPASLLLPYNDPKSAAAKITELLSVEQPREWPGFDVLAKKLSLSESTLRRRLEEEGKNYQTIKDYLRRDMAIDLLSDTSRNVADIATQLGFAEPSAFFRAFKKWTGATPGDFRRTSTQVVPANGNTHSYFGVATAIAV